MCCLRFGHWSPQTVQRLLHPLRNLSMPACCQCSNAVLSSLHSNRMTSRPKLPRLILEHGHYTQSVQRYLSNMPVCPTCCDTPSIPKLFQACLWCVFAYPAIHKCIVLLFTNSHTPSLANVHPNILCTMKNTFHVLVPMITWVQRFVKHAATDADGEYVMLPTENECCAG